MKSSRYNYLWLVVAAMCLAGCGRQQIERFTWPVMGTIAAIQVRGGSVAQGRPVPSCLKFVENEFSEVERLLNAHDAESEISRLAPLDDREVLEKCDARMKPCYEAAFKLMKASDGAFNPRWKGTNTLDLGAIAKGFAVDVAAAAGYADNADAIIDLGGNLKALRGDGGSHKPWRTGVRNPFGDGFAAVVDLREGEALATSATYYRGSHIYDGRTGLAVSNGVASVTVLCNSAMWADGLSTTLFVLGPEEGKKFLDDKLKLLVGDMEVSALWIMDGGRQEIYGNARFQGN